MNKNFEEAYKAEVQQNIPDLWSRIESSLPEKETNLNHKSEQKKKNPYAWMKWASVAAAAVLVVLILPSVAGTIFWWTFAFSNSSSDSAAPEQMVMENAVMEGDIKTESAGMETTAEAPAMNESYAEDGFIAEEEAMAEESIAATESESDILSDVQSAEMGSEYPWELYAEGLYVKVISATANDEGYNVELELYRLHEMEVEPIMEDHPFYDNGIIHAVVYEGDGEVPVVGEKYTVTLYGTPRQFSFILPFKAVLEIKD